MHSLWQVLAKLIKLLTPNERIKALCLFAVVLLVALLDVIGVASIMPFMAVVANPDMIESNKILSKLYEDISFTNKSNFLIFLGGAVFVLLVLSMMLKAYTTYAQIRFSLLREYSIGKRLLEIYLSQPYVWFLNRHSADLGKTILSELHSVIHLALLPALNLAAQSIVAAALLGLLVWVDPVLAVTVGALLGSAYFIIYSVTSKLVGKMGEERLVSNRTRFTVVNEAFGALKEIKVGGLESRYVSKFAEPARVYAEHQADAQIISILPRFALEAFAFGGMLLIVLYLIGSRGSFASAIPIIALYALAAYRLLPAMQQIYQSAAQLRYTKPAIDALHRDIVSLDYFRKSSAVNCEPLSVKDMISLRDVLYSYPGTIRPAIDGISLQIPTKTTIGFVGSTGSGKTTIVDIILGLLEPQNGVLSVDGLTITDENRANWQRCVGYVPQQIYLADDTVAGNIALGVEPVMIDMVSVERAAKIANLHEFVVTNLPDGYCTKVGERGVRLSGGQRQRIGIARALYHNPQVLILDEATSALDNLTERAVMEAVSNLGHDITIILIAHRLGTVRGCDKIYVLEKGMIKAQGTYEMLIEQDEIFKTMALLT